MMPRISVIAVSILVLVASLAFSGEETPVHSAKKNHEMLPLGSETFCNFRRKAVRRPGPAPALDLAGAIGHSDLCTMERNFLLLLAVNFEHGLLTALDVAAGGHGWGVGGNQDGGFRLGVTDVGITICMGRKLPDLVSGEGGPWRLLSLDLDLCKNERFPLGANTLGPKGGAWLAESSSDSQGKGDPVPAPVTDFCRMYREALYADGDSETIALGARIRQSDLRELEKVYLLFTLVKLGMSRDVVYEIMGEEMPQERRDSVYLLGLKLYWTGEEPAKVKDVGAQLRVVPPDVAAQMGEKED